MGRSARNKVARQKRILEALQLNAAVRVAELAETLGVTGETIRRDLAELGNEGSVNRTYGGAVAKPILNEPNWRLRHRIKSAERTQIADRAARFITPGDIVMLEGGSTIMHLAEVLAADCNALTIITGSLEVALELSANDTHTVHLCPGELNAREGCVLGPETEAFLQRYSAAIAVVGSTGITAEGLQESDIGVASVKRLMLARARKRIALLDHGKFDQAGFVTVCPLSGIDLLVTDKMPEGDLAVGLDENKVEVVI